MVVVTTYDCFKVKVVEIHIKFVYVVNDVVTDINCGVNMCVAVVHTVGMVTVV